MITWHKQCPYPCSIGMWEELIKSRTISVFSNELSYTASLHGMGGQYGMGKNVLLLALVNYWEIFVHSVGYVVNH